MTFLRTAACEGDTGAESKEKGTREKHKRVRGRGGGGREGSVAKKNRGVYSLVTGRCKLQRWKGNGKRDGVERNTDKKNSLGNQGTVQEGKLDTMTRKDERQHM